MATATNQQLIDSLRLGKSLGAELEQDKQQNAMGEILKIVSTNLNQPGESGPYQDQTTYPKKTEGQKLKPGDYIDSGDPITDDNMGPDGRPLQIKSNPLDELFIDPKTQRQNVRDKKIEDRSKSKGQGADIAEKKLRPDQKIDIPDFLQNINIKPQDLLKILQLIPAATGFNLQMADKGSSRDQLAMNPAALDALRKGTTPGLSSQEIRSLIKPFTNTDQFGHPTGSLRGV